MENLLRAIRRIVENPTVEIRKVYSGKNRANSVGDALEAFVKDALADSLAIDDESERNRKYDGVFSYLGNQNNPPDIMFLAGDAIETKKVESANAPLALNSSYPKAKLYVDNPMLTDACRNCEKWDMKDIVYVVGHVSDDSLKYLWLIYGDCFAADRSVYERIKTVVSTGVNSIPDVEFTETKELGKVKRVDPLGVTDLRIRGMWHIENPHKIFRYLQCTEDEKKFQLIALMRNEKFDSFPEVDRKSLLDLKKPGYSIGEVKIKNPDNPAKLLESKLITFRL